MVPSVPAYFSLSKKEGQKEETMRWGGALVGFLRKRLRVCIPAEHALDQSQLSSKCAQPMTRPKIGWLGNADLRIAPKC